ncbi:MAG: triacylglycerol lipase [Xanthomonadaceae bacterium]|jgi:triacylglycerol lipase|nr:triacylglycerol lipase [Xanthomonadaceae bacterium]
MKLIRILILMLSLSFVPATFAQASKSYTQTRNPIVLVHGAFGFDSLLGIYDYWFLIGSELRAGGATVYTVNLSQTNSTEVRGEQLIAQLDMLKALYGHSRFNLIGHSHGGATSRYAASVRPDLVASVTTVGAPHYGSDMADLLETTLPEDTLRRKIVADLTASLARVIALVSGKPKNPQDTVQAMLSLSTQGSAEFNARHPQGMPTTACGNGPEVANGIRYYSMGGTSVYTSILDPMDIVLAATSLSFRGQANDGLVGRCSSHWGLVLRDDYPWNHMDQVNQTLSLRGLFAPNPTSVYRSHVNRLKNLGL